MAMYSNTMRMTGLGGLDTEGMVTQLMAAESQKLYKLQKQNTTLTWKQEAYWTAIDSLQGFKDKFLSTTSSSSLVMNSSFNKFNSTVRLVGSSGVSSDTKAVSVTAGQASKSGSYKLAVQQLAEKDTYTSSGGKAGIEIDDFNVTDLVGSTPASGNVPATSGDNFMISLDGVGKKIEFTEDELSGVTDMDDFASLLNTKLDTAFGDKMDAGINAVSGKLTISAKGDGHTISMTEGPTRRPGAGSTMVSDSVFDDDAASALAGKTFKLNVKQGDSEKTVIVKFDDELDSAEKAITAINAAFGGAAVNAKFSLSEDGELTLASSGVHRDDIVITNGEAENGEVDIAYDLMDYMGSGGGSTIAKTSTLSVMGVDSGET
ncbi:MAG: hypothetical protein LBU94_05525, partial [Clostridiales bacterium]|nr:hypothetical protein [Clostridiales bacterium]